MKRMLVRHRMPSFVEYWHERRSKLGATNDPKRIAQHAWRAGREAGKERYAAARHREVVQGGRALMLLMVLNEIASAPPSITRAGLQQVAAAAVRRIQEDKA